MSEASEKLQRMVAADAEPKLAAGDIVILLEMFATKDAAGRGPSDEDWTPTYKLRAAAAEGWRWKAAKASELISSDLDGDRMSANQLFEHCQRMIRSYSSAGSAEITTVNTGKYESLADVFFE